MRVTCKTQTQADCEWAVTREIKDIFQSRENCVRRDFSPDLRGSKGFELPPGVSLAVMCTLKHPQPGGCWTFHPTTHTESLKSGAGAGSGQLGGSEQKTVKLEAGVELSILWGPVFLPTEKAPILYLLIPTYLRDSLSGEPLATSAKLCASAAFINLLEATDSILNWLLCCHAHLTTRSLRHT